MSKALSVSEASIAKATVTIQTVQLNGRNLTLGIFKQIPISPIFKYYCDSDGSQDYVFDGKPWGRVKCFPEREDVEYDGCVNTLYERAGHLYRYVVWSGQKNYGGPKLQEDIDRRKQSVNTLLIAVRMYGEIYVASQHKGDKSHRTHLAHLKKQLKICNEHHGAYSLAEYRDRIDHHEGMIAMHEAEKERAKRSYIELYEAVCALPQLFISG